MSDREPQPLQLEQTRELLARLLHECGESTQPVHDLQHDGLAHLVEVIRPARHALRVVELDRHALGAITLPALVVHRGELALLRSVRRRAPQVQLELASGQTLARSAEQLLSECDGRALELYPVLARHGSYAQRLLRFVSRRGGELGTLLVLALMLSALGLIAPAATQLAIDHALPERSPKMLSLVALAVLLVASQRALFTWLERRATLGLHARLELGSSSRLFDHLLRVPFAALAREHVGYWLETLRGARQVHGVLTDSVLAALVHLVMASVYGAALIFTQPAIGAALLGAGLVLGCTALWFAMRARPIERQLIDASSFQQDTLHEILSGVLTLRTAGAQDRSVLRWLARMLDARTAAMRMELLKARSRVLLDGLREAIQLGTLLWAAHTCLQGQLSVGSLVSLLMLSDQFVHLVASLASQLTPLSNAQSHLARVDTLLRLEDVTTGSERAVSDATSEDAVVLDGVWFRYGPGQPWVLQNYSLRIKSLEHFALRGASGMGKSTILRLIAGLYAPERGSVRLFGHEPLRVRKEVCYLPQDARLFQGSILQNLRLLSGASLDALLAASQRSGLAELVASMPMGYDTVLPSGATTLSGGQRQLIAWTAAMAAGRKLLLVDEALSQVDRIMRTRLLAMAREQARTVICVEHERGELLPSH